MPHSKYQLLVIDDEWEERQKEYRTVLEEGVDSPFELDFVENQSDLEVMTSEGNYSGYLIDLFLENNGWSITARDIIENYIRPNRPLPVFLVSALGSKKRQVQDEMNALLRSSDLIQRFFAWNAFTTTNAVDSTQAITTLRADLQISLDAWHRRSNIRKPAGEKLRILHLSDTQFLDPSSDAGAHDVERVLKRHLRKAGLPPDIVVLSGDVAYSGRPKEYRAASKWLGSLMGTFWATEEEKAFDRLFIVPGNHDVDLGICALEHFGYNFAWPKDQENTPTLARVGDLPIDQDEEFKRLGFESFLQFVESFDRDHQWRKRNQHICRVSNRFANLGVQFILVNTADLIDAKNPSKAGLHPDAITEIGKLVDYEGEGKQPFRILVSHHGPRDWNHDEWDPEDWRRFATLIHNCGINLWLCGHQHGYKRQVFDSEHELGGLEVVMAPSLTLNASVREHDERRGFLVIELERDTAGEITASQITKFECKGAQCENKTFGRHSLHSEEQSL